MKMVVEKEVASSPDVTAKLFKDIKYYLIGHVEEQIVALLDKGGANQETYLTTNVTHVITDDGDHDEVSEAKDIFDLPVVMSHWVSMSIKCGCILPYSAFAPGASQIFSGVVACPSQMSQDVKNKIWSMITFYGGKCQLNLDGKCTHLITTKAEGAKYESALQHKDIIKVVMPDWIVDCITGKKRLNEAKYHPRLIVPRRPPTPQPVVEPTPEPIIEKEKSLKKIKALSNANTAKMPETADHHTTKEQAPQGHMQSSRNNIPRQPLAMPTSDNHFQTLLQQHQMQSKKIADIPEVPKQTKQRRSRSRHQDKHPHHVLPLPETHEMGPGPYGRFQTNALDMPEMRTLRNITNNAQMSPMMMMRPPVPDGHDMSQVLTALGRASAQQCMKQTVEELHQQPHHVQPIQPPPSVHQPLQYFGHDVTQNIPRDCCLLGCVFLIIEYQSLIEHEMIETWKKVIVKFGGMVDDCYSERITHVICDSQKTDVFKLAVKDGKRVVTAHWLNDCLTVRKMSPPWRALHLPTAYPMIVPPCKDQVIAVTGLEGKDRSDAKQMIELIGGKYSGHLTRGNTVLICHRLEGAKYEKAREWRIPTVNVQWLNDLSLGYMDAIRSWGGPRYQAYNMDDPLKLVHLYNNRLMAPWTTPLKISQAALRNFKPSVHQRSPTPVDQDGNYSNGNKRKSVDNSSGPSEKFRMGSDSDELSRLPRVLFTGIEAGAVASLSEKVKSLGGKVVQSCQDCSHLVASKITRTTKFLACLSVCKFVVSPIWIEKSISQNTFVDENEHILIDIESEQQFSFKLSEALQRAKQIKVFQGMTLYVTPRVLPDARQMIDIVECGGGTLINKKPSLKAIASLKDTNGRPLFVAVTCDKDLPLCRDFIRNNVDVHSAEFILTGALTQRLDYLSFEP